MEELSEAEKRIVISRKSGISLCDLSKEKYEASITGIIYNISVICGCQLPAHEAHINALENEFKIFLQQDDFKELTVDEILTAFRMNASFQLQNKIETYGALFNIDFAGKVLVQYVEKRFNLDSKLFSICQRKEWDKIFEEEAKKRRLKVIEQFDIYLKNEKSKLDLSDCYMQLCDDGAFLNKEAFRKFYKEEDENKPEEKSIGEILKTYPSNLDKAFQAQYRAVEFLFKNMKATNKLKLYDDDMKIINPGFDI